jgi:hypothetical protein
MSMHILYLTIYTSWSITIFFMTALSNELGSFMTWIEVGSVSEHLDRVHNVVLINVYLDLRNPRGSGFWAKGAHGLVREQRGQFTNNREQRWTNPVTARRVPSK